MAFWAVEVKAGKSAAYVPPPEQARLRLSQATLSIDASPGQKAALKCKVEGADEVLICSLREGGQESTNLDLILDGYTEFSLASKPKSANVSIHLAGYLIAETDEEEEEDREEEDGIPGLENLTPQQLQAYMDADDSEGSDDEYDEEGDSDDEDDEDEDEDASPKSTVIIEDITEQENLKKPAEDKVDTSSMAVVNGGEPNGSKKGKAKSKSKAAPEAAVKEALKEAEKLLEAERMDVEEEEESSEEDDEDLESEEDEDEESEDDSGAEEEEQPETDISKKRKAPEPAKAAALVEAQKAAATDKKGKKAKTEPSAVSAASAVAPTKGEKPMKGKKTYPNGFIVENVAMGDPAGKLAKAGKKVLVKYVGKLQKTGKIFDQTKGNKPFGFRLGVNEVIKGWDQGVVGMRVGDKRKLTIPPQMAYGTKGISNVIPGNSTLLFEVELVDVK